MCQYILGDFTNAKNTLQNIASVNLSKTERARVIAYDVGGYSEVLDYSTPNPLPQAMVWRGLKRTFGHKGANELRREGELNSFKENAINRLKTIK